MCNPLQNIASHSPHLTKAGAANLTLTVALAIITGLGHYFQWGTPIIASTGACGGVLLLVSIACFVKAYKAGPKLQQSKNQPLQKEPTPPTVPKVQPVQEKPKPSIVAPKKEVPQTQQTSTVQPVNLPKIGEQKYPHLVALKNRGFIHLFDHLIQMEALSTRIQRDSEIKKMPFSEMAHVVLEMRAAIIEEVENLVAKLPHDMGFTFILGGSGAGKSTTLCFLRGDQMELKDHHYESKNDQRKIIEHRLASSGTLLPNIESINGQIFIDYPGFDDTHGTLISLGAECALRALLQKYPAQVLVLESINNAEGRCSNIAQLGSHLNRLVVNKGDCTLGLTKYSAHFNYQQIKNVETMQREQLSKPSIKELGLIGSIKMLSDMISTLSSALQGPLLLQIEKQEKELAELVQNRLQSLKDPLPDNDMKKICREDMTKTEQEIAKQAGLNFDSMLRFTDLNDAQCRKQAHRALSHPSTQMVQVNPKYPLDATHRSVLDERFKNDLLPRLESINFIKCFHDLADFHQQVVQFGLISTLGKACPEIRDFFQLELEPSMIKEYDKILIRTCIEKYKGAVIAALDPILDSIVDHYSAKFHEKLVEIRIFILRLEGCENPEHPDAWKQAMASRALSIEALKSQLKLPQWGKDVLTLPTDPINIIKLRTKNTHITDELLSLCAQEIESMHTALKGLKHIENLLDQRSYTIS